ncbi:MAG: hypothetical protein K0B09_13480 [Bacteroidales bacterium]|nr:hypothetical protein [Bacteroidales bacterium]
MKKVIIISLVCLSMLGFESYAQKSGSTGGYGNTLNLGVGLGGYSGYYRYTNRSLTVFHIDYEFDVARNFTLAPFANFYSWRGDHYRENVIPLGVKGSLYLDDLLKANPNWDFYVAGSLGFVVVNSRWDNNYNGDREYYKYPNRLFLDLHVGTEYHISNRIGLFLDLSTGVSTLGLAIH